MTKRREQVGRVERYVKAHPSTTAVKVAEVLDLDLRFVKSALRESEGKGRLWADHGRWYREGVATPREQVYDIIANRRGPITFAEIRAAGVGESVSLGSVLHALHQAGRINRGGRCGSYRYWVGDDVVLEPEDNLQPGSNISKVFAVMTTRATSTETMARGAGITRAQVNYAASSLVQMGLAERVRSGHYRRAPTPEPVPATEAVPLSPAPLSPTYRDRVLAVLTSEPRHLQTVADLTGLTRTQAAQACAGLVERGRASRTRTAFYRLPVRGTPPEPAKEPTRRENVDIDTMEQRLLKAMQAAEEGNAGAANVAMGLLRDMRQRREVAERAREAEERAKLAQGPEDESMRGQLLWSIDRYREIVATSSSGNAQVAAQKEIDRLTAQLAEMDEVEEEPAPVVLVGGSNRGKTMGRRRAWPLVLGCCFVAGCGLLAGATVLVAVLGAG